MKEIKIIEITNPTIDLVDFIDKGKGLKVIPENYEGVDGKILYRDMGALLKWINNNHNNIEIEYEPNVKKISLNNNEYWFSLVYLASDIALPIYLSMVANYIYDKLKGSLKGEKENAQVHLSVEYRDGDKYKKINYDGSVEGLEKFQKINLNEILK